MRPRSSEVVPCLPVSVLDSIKEYCINQLLILKPLSSLNIVILHMDAIAEEFDLPRVEAYQLKSKCLSSATIFITVSRVLPIHVVCSILEGMMWAALLNVQQVW